MAVSREWEEKLGCKLLCPPSIWHTFNRPIKEGNGSWQEAGMVTGFLALYAGWLIMGTLLSESLNSKCPAVGRTHGQYAFNHDFHESEMTNIKNSFFDLPLLWIRGVASGKSNSKTSTSMYVVAQTLAHKCKTQFWCSTSSTHFTDFVGFKARKHWGTKWQ